MEQKIQNLIVALKSAQESARSKWLKGVYDYALELVEERDHTRLSQAIEKGDRAKIKKCLLNGAESWSEYSWGGCSLIYDGDICERLATPSEQKRTDYGRLNPNRNEQWLDTQARALYQAANKIIQALNF